MSIFVNVYNIIQNRFVLCRIVWDLVFGTHLYNKDTSGLNAGIKGAKFSHTFLKQVLYPLEALKSVQVGETSPSGCDRPDQSYTSLP